MQDFNDDEFSKLNFSKAPKILCVPPGPKARKILEQGEIYEATAPPDPNKPKYPQAKTVIDEARGSTVRDVDGNIFIDLYAGISVSNIGHSNPLLLKTLSDQAGKLIHTYMHGTAVKVEFQKKGFYFLHTNLKV